jgi:hypothetical protein
MTDDVIVLCSGAERVDEFTWSSANQLVGHAVQSSQRTVVLDK